MFNIVPNFDNVLGVFNAAAVVMVAVTVVAAAVGVTTVVVAPVPFFF